MVQDAEAAGFNPLTALRNGGAAGFTVTSQPVLSATGQALERGLGTIGNFIANFDPFEDKMREVQFETMQAQLANLQADTRVKNRMFDVPAVSGRRQVSAGPVLAREPLPARFGQSMVPEVVAPEVVNPWPASWGWVVDPNVPNAEQFENRYGEFVGSAIGSAVTLGTDGLENWKNWGHWMDRNLGQYMPDFFYGKKRPRLSK